MKYRLNDRFFDTREEMEDYACCFAEDNIDEFIDNIYPEVDVCGHSYYCSDLLKHTDKILYRMITLDYADYLLQNSEEIEDEEGEVFII